ncbi:GL14570 [Drosophila persimilis]|uniref:GL14570 n=1 Tax=Drosophila persimilis TaxID=7234 RepID=B4GVZ7_DROPE|nr:GL14570 [Drosophila persimilis]
MREALAMRLDLKEGRIAVSRRSDDVSTFYSERYVWASFRLRSPLYGMPMRGSGITLQTCISSF